MQQVSDITERPDDAAPVLGAVPPGFEFAVEAAAAAEATDVTARDARPSTASAWRWTLERLLHRTDEDLDSVRTLDSPVREQIVADFEEERDRLEAALDRLVDTKGDAPDPILLESAGEVRLQASWAAGRLVVWAAGPGTEPASSDELEQRLGRPGRARERLDQPPSGPPAQRRCRSGARAAGRRRARLARRGRRRPRRRDPRQQRDLARARRGVGHPAGGRRLHRAHRAHPAPRPSAGRRRATVELSVRWAPALLGASELDELASAHAGPGHRAGAGRRPPAHALGARRDRERHRHRRGRTAHAAGPPPDPRDPSPSPRRSSPAWTAPAFEVPTRAGHRGRQARRSLVHRRSPPRPTPAWWCSWTRRTRTTPGSCRCRDPTPTDSWCRSRSRSSRAGPSATSPTSSPAWSGSCRC